ncbi:MAG: hypothetical protein NTX45_01710 [Proteobacteria bacterium]|nr:hypothetical protein [Pseudomonadota bacterium]
MSQPYTFSTAVQLVTNYIQSESMAPDKQFQALQTEAGAALLFSIGTNEAFNVTSETPGAVTGWITSNITPAGVTAKNFAVAQPLGAATVDIVLAATSANTGDQLYVSLANVTGNVNWVDNPNWQLIRFDDPFNTVTPLVINDVFIANTAAHEYIVVDILRNPSSQDGPKLINRYYIDPTKATKGYPGQAWIPHDVAGDIDATSVVSCLGRRSGDSIDGIYTGGMIGGQSQLMFQPVYNKYSPTTPAPVARLELPAGVVSSALAAVPNGDGTTTDLFVAGGQTIYYFASDNQKDLANAKIVLTGPIFQGIADLFGYGDKTTITLWGRNQGNQIFYTTCARANLLDPAAWSVPLPICEGVEQVSPYLNRSNNSNCFFVHTGQSRLQQANQNPTTTTWMWNDILLPVDPTIEAVSKNSYTTRIQVSQADQPPLSGAEIALSTPNRVGVYINGLYYILDTTPINVKADQTGAVTIIEWIDSIVGTNITASFAEANTSSDPMAASGTQLMSLTSADDLRAATITDADGNTRPLVDPGINDADLNAAAAAFSVLGSLQANFASGTPTPTGAPVTLSSGITVVSASQAFVATDGRVKAQATALALALRNTFDPFKAIEAAAGDVFSYLKSAKTFVVHLAQDAATSVWNFFAQIEGVVYTFALDAWDKVVGAAQVIWQAIKTAIEDLIAWLLFLFNWKAYVRTKDVFKKLTLLSLQQFVDCGSTLKADLSGVIQSAQAEVKQLTGVSTGNPGDHPLAYKSIPLTIPNPLASAGMLVSEALSANARLTSIIHPTSSNSNGSAELALARDFVKNDTTMQTAFAAINSTFLSNSAYLTMSLTDVSEKLLGITSVALLDSADSLLNSLIDVLVTVGQDGIDALNKPITIPVVSDILKLAHVSIGASFLDVVMMAAAIPATLIYMGKHHNKVPFYSGDGFSDYILAAKNPADLAVQAARAGAEVTKSTSKLSTIGLMPTQIITPTPAQAAILSSVAHNMNGLGSIIHNYLKLASEVAKVEAVEGALAVADLIASATDCTSFFFELGEGAPNQPAALADMSTAVAALQLVTLGIGWWIPHVFYGSKPTSGQAAEAEFVTTGFNAILAVLAAVPSCYNIYDFATASSGNAQTKGIIDESSNLSKDFGACAEVADAPLIAEGTVFIFGNLQFALAEMA